MKTTTKQPLTPVKHGTRIYRLVLGKYYGQLPPHEKDMETCYPNPFNNGRMTLYVTADGASHHDSEGAIAPGNHFDFASLHYNQYGDKLLETISRDLLEQNDPEYCKPLDEILGTPPLFSYFLSPISNTKPLREITPTELYGLIKSDTFKKETEKLRSITDPAEARKYKSASFDYITPAGTFTQRNMQGLKKHSGLMVIDFDHVDDPAALGKKLLDDEYFTTALYFISPSGDGLKWIIEVKPSEAFQKIYFHALGNYLNSKYGYSNDASGSDVCRACFLPHDLNVYINPKYITQSH